MYRLERHLYQAKRQIRDSFHHHWTGLTVFLTRPEVALDHNSAPRALRTHGDKTPPDLSAFLPWQRPDERRHQLVQPVPEQQISFNSLPQ
jgi:hypothetical protein